MIFYADESALRAKSSLIILALDKHHKTLTETTKLLKNIKLTMNLKNKAADGLPWFKTNSKFANICINLFEKSKFVKICKLSLRISKFAKFCKIMLSLQKFANNGTSSFRSSSTYFSTVFCFPNHFIEIALVN